MRYIAIPTTLVFASMSAAQTVGVRFQIDQPILQPGESTNVTLMAAFDDTAYAVAGLAMNISFDSPITDPRRHWSDLGHVEPFSGGVSGPILSDDSIDGILAGQLNFPPAGIFADPSNPIAFYQATFTAPLDASAIYEVALLTEVLRFDVNNARHSSERQNRMDDLKEGEAIISVVPAPPSLAVLALGLAAHRRRRGANSRD